jgi:hypothetical protein
MINKMKKAEDYATTVIEWRIINNQIPESKEDLINEFLGYKKDYGERMLSSIKTHLIIAKLSAGK